MAVARAECTCELCGNIFYKETKRQNRRLADDWEKWASENIKVCPDCEREIYEEEAEELAQKASANGLPKLRGSEKQITWAEHIRAELLESMEKSVEEARECVNGLDEGEEKDRCIKLLRIFEQILIQVRNETSAAWWIDKRFRDGCIVMGEIYREQCNKKLEL